MAIRKPVDTRNRKRRIEWHVIQDLFAAFAVVKA
jgi:hypothetical protein